jgi:tripartite-type tricarboxylate transporter receptor subunit TctC
MTTRPLTEGGRELGRVDRRDFLVATTGLAAWGLSTRATGQAARYPTKPVRVIVAFPPGGLTDAYARHFAEHAQARLGQPFIVENKPGAGAVLAIDAVAKSPPDGYTLLVTTSGTVWQNRVLFSKLPYNLDKDLTPITLFPSGPLVVAVSEKVPARTMGEFIAWAKNNAAFMGTYAAGSYPHMLADQLNRSASTKLTSVHYKGESPMWVDVASGQLQIAVGSYQAWNTVHTRGVRAIGVTGAYRSPKLPDVPTLVEQGIDSRLVALEGGLPLMAPTGTPEPVLQALSRVAVDWANSPKGAQLRENFAIPNKPKNLAETRKDWERDVPVWIKVAVDLGVRLD